MKSYLSLIPICAKIHKRQNLMTRLCIIFSVFMVTAVFSMAEMGTRMELNRLNEKHDGFTLFQAFDSVMGQSLFLTAAVLFLLILLAGVLMITSSIHSSVSQRTKFFGMMRCIGMSKEQLIHFVRMEALYLCKTSVPIGVLLGIVVTWVLCIVLKFMVGEEFSDIPLFGISLIGIISGIIMGISTVLIASSSPARQAARVSPAAAALGEPESMVKVQFGIHSDSFNIPLSLGIHHAVSAKKNLILMTGSFALSIILFLNFSVLIEFVDYLMPRSSSTSDIDISSLYGTDSIDHTLVDEIKGMNGVEEVYGRRSCFEVPAEIKGRFSFSDNIDIVSFDDFDLECLEKDDMLKKGSDISKIYGDSHYVLASWDKNCLWNIGDKIKIEDQEFEIAGLLKYDLFSDNGMTNGKITIITSGETFIHLTGITDYSLIMVQMADDAAKEDIEAIKNAAGDSYLFDYKGKTDTSGTYIAFIFFIYCFLGMITLVAVFNIVNCISMSVCARTRQYGFMRAVGMDGVQLTKMIAVETFTYAVFGCIIGCIMGLYSSKLLYKILIMDHFEYAVWNFPAVNLMMIILFVFIASLSAIYGPSKRLLKVSITETINEM